VKDISVEDFDALLIPGGYSPDHLRADEAAVKFVKCFFEATSGICYLPCTAATDNSTGFKGA